MNHFTIRKSSEALEAIYQGRTKVSYFRLFPGVLLGFNQIKTRELPVEPFSPIFETEIILRINFSLDGICEVRTASGDYIYVKGGYMSISRDRSAKAFSYPTAAYTGIEIFIQADAMENSTGIFNLFDIDITRLVGLYLNHRLTLLANRWDALAPAVRAVHAQFVHESSDIEQLRLYCLLILRILSSGSIALEPASVTALTKHQVESAKAAAALLSIDLSKRITISEVAAQLNVGESSLKNWFHDVYGKSISEYMRDLRISEAKRLLSDSNHSISEIAGKVGYENQAKFTAMFHKYCGYTPTAYRKQIE